MLAGPGAWNRFGELDDKPVWVSDVQSPVAPGPVRRPAQYVDSKPGQAQCLRIDIIGDEHHLTGGSRRRMHSGKPCCPALFVQREPSLSGGKLGVPGIGELVMKPHDIAIERHSFRQVRHVQNHIPQLHTGNVRTRLQD